MRGALVVPRAGKGGAFNVHFEQPETITAHDGSFAFSWLPHSYTELLVIAARHVPQVVERPADGELEVQLQPDRPIVGQVLTPNGKPAGGVRLRIIPHDDYARESLTRWDSARNGTAVAPVRRRLGLSAITDDRGRYRFGQIDGGEFTIVVESAPHDWALVPTRVRAGISKSLQLAAGREIRGTVAGGIKGTVAVFCDGEEIRRAELNRDGSFLIPNLPGVPLRIDWQERQVLVPATATDVRIDGP